MKVLITIVTVLACGAWLVYAFIVALVADVNRGSGDGQFLIAVASVVILAVGAWLARLGHRTAARGALLLATAGFVGWAAVAL